VGAELPQPTSPVPLYRKLGIADGSVVVLKAAPFGFEDRLTGRSPTSEVHRRPVRRRDLTVWFVTTHRALRDGIDGVVAALEGGGLWICWPKKSSAAATDLTFDLVQGAGLERGLVDHKICAIDETWTALRFAPRR
jgi:hypothetical protein